MSMRAFLALGLLISLGCGDDEDTGRACVAVEACGGDISGQWAIESLCFSQAQGAPTFENGLPIDCQGSFVGGDAEVDGGTLDYGPGAAFTTAGTARVRSEYRFAIGCLRTARADLEASTLSGALCTDIAGELLAGLALITPGEGTTSCSVEGGACVCESTALVDTSGAGSYTTNADQIVIDSRPSPYCVSGDRLEIEVGILGGTALARRR